MKALKIMALMFGFFIFNFLFFAVGNLTEEKSLLSVWVTKENVVVHGTFAAGLIYFWIFETWINSRKNSDA